MHCKYLLINIPLNKVKNYDKINSIDEAVELAKRYGTEQAPVFINGILDRIWKDNELHVKMQGKSD